jgi:DNA-binding response OmpR family regulator
MRLLLVEDNPLVGTMLRVNLSQEGFEVDWHKTGESALAAVEAGHFDLALLDIGLAGISGIEVAGRIRKLGLDTPIIMLTANDDLDTRVHALDRGADDYLPKPFDMDELIARVRAHLRRSSGTLEQLPESELTVGRAVLQLERKELRGPDGQSHQLTAKEVALLQFMVRNPARVLTRANILEEVWGDDDAPSMTELDDLIAHLRGCIEQEPSHPRYIVTARGIGYRFEP